jgi:hypothetical protein
MDLESELYVRARLSPGSRFSSDELDGMYDAFFFLPNGQRRAAQYVYLNIYNSDGHFLEQLAYDLVRSQTDQY